MKQIRSNSLTLAALLACLTLPASHAQERLARDEALRYSELVGTAQEDVKRAPFATEVNLKQPVAVRDGEYGLMLLPAAKLTADLLKTVGPDPVPIGQLWLRKLAPLVNEQVVPETKLNLVYVTGSAGSATVPCCNLAVRKASDARLELLVFGKGKEPLLKAPLSLRSSPSSAPLDMEVERESDRGRVTVRLAGSYAADFAVTDPELF